VAKVPDGLGQAGLGRSPSLSQHIPWSMIIMRRGTSCQ